MSVLAGLIVVAVLIIMGMLVSVFDDRKDATVFILAAALVFVLLTFWEAL